MAIFGRTDQVQSVTPSSRSTLLSNGAHVRSNSSEPANIRREMGYLGGRPRSLSDHQPPAQNISPQGFRRRPVSASGAAPSKQSIVSDYRTDVIYQPQPRSAVLADEALAEYIGSPCSANTQGGVPSWSIDQQYMDPEANSISPGMLTVPLSPDISLSQTFGHHFSDPTLPSLTIPTHSHSHNGEGGEMNYGIETSSLSPGSPFGDLGLGELYISPISPRSPSRGHWSSPGSSRSRSSSRVHPYSRTTSHSRDVSHVDAVLPHSPSYPYQPELPFTEIQGIHTVPQAAQWHYDVEDPGEVRPAVAVGQQEDRTNSHRSSWTGADSSIDFADDFATANDIHLNVEFPEFQQEELDDDNTDSRVPKDHVGSGAITAASTKRRKHQAKWRCDWPGCNATFTARHNMRRRCPYSVSDCLMLTGPFQLDHINSHQGIRAFKCSLCNADFGTRHVMIRHFARCEAKKILRDKKHGTSVGSASQDRLA
jgi:hypothetical protein